MQSVASPAADPGVSSPLPAGSCIFMEIDHGYSRLADDSRMVVVSYKRKYVSSLPRKSVWLGELTVST